MPFSGTIEKEIKILIVVPFNSYMDDFLSKMKQNHFILTIIHSSDEMFEKLTNEFFDIIILSEGNEDVNGFELCHQLKITPLVREIPTIIALNTCKKSYIQKAYNTGADDYLLVDTCDIEAKIKIDRLINVRQTEHRMNFLNQILNTRIKERFEYLTKEIKEHKDVIGALQDSAIHYEQLSGKTPFGVCIVDVNGNVTYANHNLSKILEIPVPSLESDYNLFDSAFLNEIGLSHNFKESLDKQKLTISEHSFTVSKFQKKHIRATISPLYGVYRELAGVEIVIEDNTQNKKNEELIKLERDISVELTKADSFNEILPKIVLLLTDSLEVTAAGIAFFDKKAQIHSIYEIGYSEDVNLEKLRDDFRLNFISNKTRKIISSNDLENVFSAGLHDIVANQVRTLVSFPIKKRNKIIAGLFIAYPHTGEVPYQYLAILEAITAQIGELINRIRTKEKIEQSEENYRSIIEGQSDLISRFLPDGTLTFVNAAYCNYFNLSPKELVGSNWIEKSSERTRSFVREKLQQLTPEKPTQKYGYKTFKKGGKPKWTEWFNTAVFDENNNLVEYQSVGHDVTLFIETTEKLQQALAEKELLLSEVHHRVKNNMQMVSSMLSLQARNIKRDNIEESFMVSVNRIKSMAIIHEKLYESKNFGEIEMRGYIKDLCEDLVAAYYNEKDIKLRLNIPPLMFEIDTSITIGLLINELVTNSLKYAFYGKDEGTISVTLYHTYKNNFQFIVEDDGCGLPMDFEERKRKSLGMQLIYGFVKELFGDISFEIDNGTKFIINFKQVKRSRKKED